MPTNDPGYELIRRIAYQTRKMTDMHMARAYLYITEITTLS